MKHTLLKNTKFYAAAIAALITSTTYASSFAFENPVLQGSGCRRGTTSTVTSPDGKALSVLFDDFAVEVPQYDGDNDNDQTSDLNRGRVAKLDASTDHKRCAMKITAKIPEGEVIDAISIRLDMRGSAYIEGNAAINFKSTLTNWQGRTARFAGGRAQLIAQENWNQNNFQDEWLVSKTIQMPIKTNCHQNIRNKVSFSITNALMAKIGGRNPNIDEVLAFLTMDSSDLGGRMQLRLITKRCGQGTNFDRNNGRIRVSDNSRDLNDRNHGETRADRDLRRQAATNTNRSTSRNTSNVRGTITRLPRR